MGGDYDHVKAPKTRQESKGKDKQGGGPYSSKHVRMQSALIEMRASMPKPSPKTNTKS